jgi:hypothetical protein
MSDNKQNYLPLPTQKFFFQLYLSSGRGVGLVEHGPDLGLGLLPPRQVPGVVVVLKAELLGSLLGAGLVRVLGPMF